jgi:hypothetical protein
MLKIIRINLGELIKRVDPSEFVLAGRLKMVEIAVKFVEACLAKLADLRMEKAAICVDALREEFADGRCWGDLNRFIVLNRNN